MLSKSLIIFIKAPQNLHFSENVFQKPRNLYKSLKFLNKKSIISLKMYLRSSNSLKNPQITLKSPHYPRKCLQKVFEKASDF
jgi:hypothetical protein